MICALCKGKEADKKNTHFLTDGIIRSCLNLDGSAQRERGWYFDMSSEQDFIKFNFQREVPVDKLTSNFGRPVSEEEIENSRINPYSIDYVFCSECEKIFSEIENEFIVKFLPKFRKSDLTGMDRMELNDVKTIRLFFFIQIWRTSVCDEIFQLSSRVKEELRIIILNHSEDIENRINKYPLAITYLQTLGDLKEYTSNYVGYIDDSNPYIILMNDFVIQFYDERSAIKYVDFYGLIIEDTFRDLINYDEALFVVNIFDNERRKRFLNDFIMEEKVSKIIDYYTIIFEEHWQNEFGSYPSIKILSLFLQELTGEEEVHALQFSEANVLQITRRIIGEELNIREQG